MFDIDNFVEHPLTSNALYESVKQYRETVETAGVPVTKGVRSLAITGQAVSNLAMSIDCNKVVLLREVTKLFHVLVAQLTRSHIDFDDKTLAEGVSNAVLSRLELQKLVNYSNSIWVEPVSHLYVILKRDNRNGPESEQDLLARYNYELTATALGLFSNNDKANVTIDLFRDLPETDLRSSYRLIRVIGYYLQFGSHSWDDLVHEYIHNYLGTDQS